jgi:hypothetical protein
MKKTLSILLAVLLFPGVASAQLPPDRYDEYVPQHRECAQYVTLAVRVGWDRKQLATLERLMWRESRCQAQAFNPDDPNGGSHGLLQINGFWCQPSRWYPRGYLQTFAVVATCRDLYEPRLNLIAAWHLFDYSDGWSQWYLP